MLSQHIFSYASKRVSPPSLTEFIRMRLALFIRQSVSMLHPSAVVLSFYCLTPFGLNRGRDEGTKKEAIVFFKKDFQRVLFCRWQQSWPSPLPGRDSSVGWVCVDPADPTFGSCHSPWLWRFSVQDPGLSRSGQHGGPSQEGRAGSRGLSGGKCQGEHDGGDPFRARVGGCRRTDTPGQPPRAGRAPEGSRGRRGCPGAGQLGSDTGVGPAAQQVSAFASALRPHRFPPKDALPRGGQGVVVTGHRLWDSLPPDTLQSELLSLAHPFPAIFVPGSLCLRPTEVLSHFNSPVIDEGSEDHKALVTPSGSSLSTGAGLVGGWRGAGGGRGLADGTQVPLSGDRIEFTPRNACMPFFSPQLFRDWSQAPLPTPSWSVIHPPYLRREHWAGGTGSDWSEWKQPGTTPLQAVNSSLSGTPGVRQISHRSYRGTGNRCFRSLVLHGARSFCGAEKAALSTQILTPAATTPGPAVTRLKHVSGPRGSGICRGRAELTFGSGRLSLKHCRGSKELSDVISDRAALGILFHSPPKSGPVGGRWRRK